MRLLDIIFILAITIFGSDCKCPGNTLVYDPHCGFDKDCTYQGANKRDLDNENCRRKAQKLATITRIFKGWCPSKRKKCTPTPDKE